MALTKEQRIEVQESAKFNYHRRLRDVEDKKQLQKQIEEKVAEATKPSRVEPVVKKGK